MSYFQKNVYFCAKNISLTERSEFLLNILSVPAFSFQKFSNLLSGMYAAKRDAAIKKGSLYILSLQKGRGVNTPARHRAFKIIRFALSTTAVSKEAR